MENKSIAIVSTVPETDKTHTEIIKNGTEVIFTGKKGKRNALKSFLPAGK